ncbi:hypothetical protein [Nonomuraea sediminis]|uniref:hypothetical protein n=1 Tax=Nonomuraea sediminis TaxID=2835864 RepID=UPI001BDBF6F2|nr:hypothetical protein [Nonomuraea sediminis]
MQVDQLVAGTRHRVRPSRQLPGFLTDPYVLVSTALVVWGLVITAYHIRSGDWQAHVASIRALVDNPWHPANPLVGGSGPWPYFEPYELLLAFVARATGLSAETVFELAGPLNGVLLFWALRRFCRRLGGGRWTPVLVLVFTLFLWGVKTVGWSGVFALNSLVSGFSYPATFAGALALLFLDTLLSFRSGPTVRRLALLCVLSGALVLINSATALGAASAGAGLILFRCTRWSPWRLLALLAPAAAGLFALLYWPYFGFSTLLNRGEGFDQVQTGLLENPIAFYGLSLLGLPALLRDRRRQMGPELLGMFAVCTAVILVGVLAGVGSVARLIPFPVLALHLALARHLVGRPRRWGRYRKVVAAATVIGACATSGSAVLQILPTNLRLGRYQDVAAPLRFVQRYLRPGDVVLTADQAAARQLPVWGIRSVAPGYEHFFVPDEDQRRQAVRSFLDARTSVEERQRIVDDYRARCVLSAASPYEPLPGFALKEAASPALALYCRY